MEYHVQTDRLNYKGGKKDGGSECVLYADDTLAKVTGEVCREIKLKVQRILDH